MGENGGSLLDQPKPQESTVHRSPRLHVPVSPTPVSPRSKSSGLKSWRTSCVQRVADGGSSRELGNFASETQRATVVAMPSLPSGTVTLFFTDVEGSTQLSKSSGEATSRPLSTITE